MKAKSIFAASLLIAGAAFADSTTVETSYVLGVMPVSASGKDEVILSVPWVAEGPSGVTCITVTNLVKTAGLDDGDKLTWYDTTAQKYMAWEVETDGAAVPYWKPVTTIDDKSVIPAEGETINRGEAIVLKRSGTSNTIYVIGQVGSSGTTTTTTIPVNSGDTWQLLAPPRASTSDVDFNSAATADWSKCVGDEITIDTVNGLFITYKCVDLGSEKSPRYVWTTSAFAAEHSAGIPAGRGFWYHRAKNNNEEVTITWNNVPNN